MQEWLSEEEIDVGLIGSEEDRRYLGHFWLPSKGEASAVDGVMTLDNDGALLLLRDLLDGDRLDDEIVFARLQGGEQATLFNCYGFWKKNASGETLRSQVRSTLVVMGCLRGDVGGYCWEFRLPGSEKWLNDQCFTPEGYQAQQMSIHFKPWESFEYALGNDLLLERTYKASLSGEQRGTESYKIVREMIYRLKSKSRLMLEEHWGMMFQLKRLFEFLTQQSLIYESMKIYDISPIASYDPDIRVHHVDSYKNDHKQLSSRRFLIYSYQVKDRVSVLIGGWMKLMMEHPAPFQHYFHAFDRQRKDGVLHFVWNLAALEELHKMRYGRNKTHLLDRLKAMRDRWAEAFYQIPSDETLRNIRDSRNYHAHADARLRDKAAQGWLLFRYGDFLMALSNLEILTLLGFEKKEAVSITQHNHWMMEALNLTTYPGGDVN